MEKDDISVIELSDSDESSDDVVVLSSRRPLLDDEDNEDDVVILKHVDSSFLDNDASIARALQMEELELQQEINSRSEELFDPNPDARALFLQFDRQYFDGKLASVEVKWSARMTLCAGLCEYHKGGYCVIKLSEKLLQFRTRKELLETLLHEMIHAYLFVTRSNKDRDGHGPEFQKHMARLNEAGGYNISIYHNFIDEVEHFRTHWWKCQGSCGRIVKRSMNRKPGPSDWWYADHERKCGGEYRKIKEPNVQRKKRPRTASDVESSELVHTNRKKPRTLESFFVPRDTSSKYVNDTSSKYVNDDKGTVKAIDLVNETVEEKRTRILAAIARRQSSDL